MAKLQAIRMLGEPFDPWRLAGPAHAPVRAKIMSELLGRKVPHRRAGVTALVDEFMRQCGLTGKGSCLANRMDLFAAHCRAALAAA